jgi:hypothetical protein
MMNTNSLAQNDTKVAHEEQPLRRYALVISKATEASIPAQYRIGQPLRQ